MRKVASVLAGVGVITLSSFVPSVGSVPSVSAAPTAAGAARSLTLAPPAPGTSLSFDEAQAVAQNGTIGAADEERICGDATGKRFLAELLNDPVNYKIPYRLGDVVAGTAKPNANLGHQMMMSGTVDGDVFGTGDFPFDHPGGSDFNMDVIPDAPYQAISQVAGLPSNAPMHTELAEAWVPHLPAASTGPATGMTWEANAEMARQEVQPGYFPTKGDRVIVMGRWVNDCGHPPFQTELHPLSFLAWSHTEGDKTVAQTYYAPYREMQQYSFDRSKANKVNDTARPFQGAFPFPFGLIASVLRIQGLGGFDPIDHLESWGLLEAVNKPLADWYVCAPAGTSGDTLDVTYDFRARPGVVITATPDPSSGCARMHVDLKGNKTPEPVLRTCTLPWDWLSKVAADEAGVPTLDLKATIKGFVNDASKPHVDPDPIMDCYDPLKGAAVNPTPLGQNITVDDTIAQPFYGRVEVAWAQAPPPSSTTSSTGASSSSSSTASSTSSTVASSTSSSSSTSSTAASSSTTTPTGQSLTVTPGTVNQGAAAQISSGGWMPDTSVTFTLDGTTVLGTIQTNRFGVAEGSFTIPSATAVGRHEVVAKGTGTAGAAEVRAAITVTAAAPVVTQPAVAASGSLPVTGASIAGAVALGSLTLLAGIAVLALVQARRRRTPLPS